MRILGRLSVLLGFLLACGVLMPLAFADTEECARHITKSGSTITD